MLHKLVTVAAWAVLVFIAYSTISPIQGRPMLLTSPNAERLAAFAALGALLCVAYPRHIIFVCLVVLGSAVLLEFLQLLTPDRHAHFRDAIYKIAGGAGGIVAGRATMHFKRANRWFQN